VFPPSPTVDDVLRGPRPKRAQTYWREAIAQLRHAKAVGYYRELEPLALTRKGWADAWLAQPLDIRPSNEGRQVGAQISQRARRAQRPGTRAVSSAASD
jgi:hypothetical protein